MMRHTRSVNMLVVALLLMGSGMAAAADIHVEGGLTREFVMAPGSRAEGRLVLRNSAAEPRQVKVYQTDYFFQANGQTLYGDPGSVQRSNSAWITVAPRRLTIPGNSFATVSFEVNTPDSQALAGTYWSVLMVEPIDDSALEPPDADKDKVAVGLRAIMRYAIQVVTHMGNTGSRAIKIAHKQLILDDSGHTLALDVENTGERWLRPKIRLELYDASGALVGRFTANPIRVYPGCSQRGSAKLGKLQPGKFTALALIDNGDELVWGAQYELEIK